MKKISALLLALCLLCSVAMAETEVTANAPEVDVYVSAYMEENSTYENGFIVYIPEGIHFNDGCRTASTTISMNVYNPGWREGTKLQVALKASQHFCFGLNDDGETWWGDHNLCFDGEWYDGDDRAYSIAYDILVEGEGGDYKLVPWEFDSYGDEVYFAGDEYTIGELMKFIQACGEHGDRYQEVELKLELKPGDCTFREGTYSDKLTFTVVFGECDVGELYWEGKGIKVPMHEWDDEHDSEVFVDESEVEYYRVWNEETEKYTYYNAETDAEATGLTALHLKFPAWADALEGDGEPYQIGNFVIYNSFVDNNYNVFPAELYDELFTDNDMTGNWLNELYFNPNESDWPW